MSIPRLHKKEVKKNLKKILIWESENGPVCGLAVEIKYRYLSKSKEVINLIAEIKSHSTKDNSRIIALKSASLRNRVKNLLRDDELPVVDRKLLKQTVTLYL